MVDRIDRLMKTINDSSDAFLDAMRAGNERAFRVSGVFVDEMQRSQREVSDLGRIWLHSPLDLIGFTNETFATMSRSQRRRLELGRTLFSELGGIRDEARDTIQRVTTAGRTAARVGVSAGRDVVSRVGDEISERAEQVSDAMSDTPPSNRRGNSGSTQRSRR